MTAYNLHHQQSNQTNENLRTIFAEAKARRRKQLDQVERRRAENYKRFLARKAAFKVSL